MSLSLPADIEPHLSDAHEWSDPAVYCLWLDPPSDLRERWNTIYDHEPPYLEEVELASSTLYVGATGNLIHRLEDHNEGKVRQGALTSLCEIEGVRNIWWFDDATRAFERENGLAMTLQNEYPDYYVHSR